MENLLESQHGIAAILASIAVLLCLHFLKGVGEFLFELFKKKAEDTGKEITQISLALNQNTQAVRDLRIQIGVLERELVEVHKFKSDSQKLFSAIKIIAGKRWPDVRKAMEEDYIPK